MDDVVSGISAMVGRADEGRDRIELGLFWLNCRLIIEVVLACA
jgi:hypothetical protein